jgi:serine/threonine protein phosphatase PrpC
LEEPKAHVLRFYDQNQDEPVLHSFARGTALVYVRKAPERGESPNQDAAALVPLAPDGGLLVVADGAGGQPAGAQAVRLAVTAFIRTVRHAVRRGNEDLRSAILAAFDNANQTILDLGIGAATTLAVAEIRGEHLRCYHVGDSQIMQFGQRGKRKYETLAHSPVGYAVEAGVLGEKEALVHEHRHLVTNMLGMAEMRIDVGPLLPLARHDTVVVASDGLLDNVYPDEIVKTLRAGDFLPGGRSLARRCRERMDSFDPTRPGKPDDVTFLAYRRRG